MEKADLPKPEKLRRWRDRTHRCYELSGMIVGDNPTWTLVHGRVRPEGFPFDYGHAWVKRDGVVYDPVEDRSFTVEEYAATYEAVEVATYTNEQLGAVMAMNVRHWGPWDPGTLPARH